MTKRTFSLREIGGIAAIVVVACAALWLSKDQWLDPIVDAGRDLYLPEQLAHGAKLYRDYRYNYPPAAPEILALLVRLFGSSLALYEVIGIILAITTAIALYLILRTTAGVEAAVAMTMLFAAVNVAGRPGFNFLFPYAHAMTIGIAAVMLFLASLIRYLFVEPAHRREFAIVAFGVLACWTKLEFAAAVCAVMIVAAVLHPSIRSIAVAFAVVNVAVFGIVAVHFRDTRWLSENIVSPSLIGGASARSFYSASLLGDASSFIFLVAGAVAIGGLAIVIHFAPRVSWLALPIGLAMTPEMFLRPWPLAHLALMPVVFRAKWRDGPLPILWAASAATTLRIAGNFSPMHGGFAYLVPTYALIGFVLWRLMPKGAVVWMMLVAGVALRGVAGLDRVANVDRDAVIKEFVVDMAARPPGSMVVFPEGVSLNYFTHRFEPLRYYLFTPPESADPAIEREIIRELLAAKPRYVAFVSRSVREYGSRGFGVDYDQKLMAAIERNYHAVRTWRRGGFSCSLREINSR